MAVPSRASSLPGETRREQIMDCAVEVFARKGFHETSIADICARAEISRATLYQYFKDKRDVLASLIDRLVNRVIKAVEEWPRFQLPPGVDWSEADNVAFVEGRCHQVMQLVFADTDTASLVLRMARSTGFVHDTLARIDEHVVGAIEADVRAGLDLGLLRPLEPHVAARFIVGGIEKLVIGALDEGRTPDMAGIAHQVAEWVSTGILASRRPATPATHVQG
jgi:AcrR family transcriptional regulator